MTTQRGNGKAIARLRRARGLSQLDLALQAGVSERTVRNAEQGRAVKRAFLGFMASVLQSPLEELIDEEAFYSSELAEHALRIRAELKSAFAELQAYAETASNEAALRSPAAGSASGSIYLTALLSEARRRGVHLPAILQSSAEASCQVRFEAPLYNPFSVALRGHVRASSRSANASFRWLLVCSVSGSSVDCVEAFCGDE